MALTFAPAYGQMAAVPVQGHQASDLVFSATNNVWIMTNSANSTPGARGFGSPTQLQAGANNSLFMDIATGDLTADGQADIVTIDDTHLRVIDGATLGTHFDAVLNVPVNDMVVCDFDGDSVQDIVLATPFSLLMLHGPTLNTVVLDSAQALFVVAGKFDSDSALDLAYRENSGAVVVLHGATSPGGPTNREVLPLFATPRAAGALDPTGQLGGPLTNPDELVTTLITELSVVRFRNQASVATIAGTGCGGPTPTHSVFGGLPILGNNGFGSQLAAATPSSFCVLAYQAHQPSGSPPVLSNLGLCTHAFDTNGDTPLLFGATDALGQSSMGLAVPTNTIFVGVEFKLQWAVLDGGDPITGLTLSPAILLRIGEY